MGWTLAEMKIIGLLLLNFTTFCSFYNPFIISVPYFPSCEDITIKSIIRFS